MPKMYAEMAPAAGGKGQMMANEQNITLEITSQLPAMPDILQTGDPCPCCGQPIKTTDPVLLRLLSFLRDEMAPPSRSELEGTRNV